MANMRAYTPINIEADERDDLTDEIKTDSPSPPLPHIQENEPISDVDLAAELSDNSEEGAIPVIHKLNSKGRLIRKYSTVRIQTRDLTEEECKTLKRQSNILSDTTLQIAVYNESIKKFPALEYGFSMVSGIEAQAAFVCKMIRKGYVKVSEKEYDSIYNTLMRHRKYGITREHISTVLETIANNVLKHCSVATTEDLQKTKQIWSKSNAILNDIAAKAYKSNINSKFKKKSKTKSVKRNRMRIRRSMSSEDIQCVLGIWTRMIAENKEKVSNLLAVKIQKKPEVFNKFQKMHIDVFNQSTVIIDMLDKTIQELENTDHLVPFLKGLGRRHIQMGIKPQSLAVMKQIILELIKDVLSFNYDKKTKNAWQRVLTFIVGMMMMEYNNRMRRGTTYSHTSSRETSTSWSDENGQFNRPTLGSQLQYDSNDVGLLENALCSTVVLHCQITWKHINNDKMISNAVRVFYEDLLNCKQEIRELFSNSNMQEQVSRLVKAIGSTVTLLDDLDTLIPILEELGKRHVYYNVKPEHFKYMKKCWFNMLRQALHLQWNKQINNAWHVAWDFMTYHMKSSLEDALLLYVPPEPVCVNFKLLFNHIDKIKLSDLSVFGDIWYAAYTGDNSSQSYAFGHGVHASQNQGKLDGDGLLPFGGVRCLNGLQTVDKYRNLKEPYIRYFEDEDSWYLRGNMVGTFCQTYELQSYPFDMHKLEFIFSLQVDDTIAKFNKDRVSVRLMPFKLESMAGTNYNVHDPVIELVEMSAIKGGSSSGRRYTHCKVTIPITRKYIHHIYNVILPLMFIQLIAFSIYFTDLFPITARLILSMTLFLTLFAFRRAVFGGLPPMPYLTLIDHAFNSACLLSVYHVTGLCAINQLQHLDGKVLYYVNFLIAGLGLLLFLIIHIYLLLKAKYYISLYPKYSDKQDEEVLYKTGNASLSAVAKSAKSRWILDPSVSPKRSMNSAYSGEDLV